MHVDEARRDDETTRVDLARCFRICDLAEGRDLAVLYGQVAVEPRIARAVDDLAVADEEVEGGGAVVRERCRASSAGHEGCQKRQPLHDDSSITGDDDRLGIRI